MTSYVVKNNVESLVTNNPLAQAATTLNVTASEGANFPSTFPFLITIWDETIYPDPSDDSGMEIVKCTARSTDALTIVRGQEGTGDVAHTLGERVAMLITAGIFNDATYGLATKLDDITAGAEVNLFEEITNVLREKSAGGYDNDFVIGSPILADDGDTAHDSRMWFDKSKGAFRAGRVVNNAWDDINVGLYSSAFGNNTKAYGENSHAEGNSSVASGENSHVEGLSCVSTALASHAEGEYTSASNTTAHAEGCTTSASGYDSHAEGCASYATNYYTHAEGWYARAYLPGQHAKADGRFSYAGDAQYSKLVARIQTTDATQTELKIYNASSSERIVLPANRTWAFTINIAVRQTAGAGTVGDSAGYELKGVIKRDGAGNTALVGSILKTILAEDQASWDVTAEADDTNEALAIKVTGESGKTIHWVATVHLTEVG